MAEDDRQKVLLSAPYEGIFGGYRAQAASDLRIDAWPGDVPGLLDLGCKRVLDLPPRDASGKFTAAEPVAETPEPEPTPPPPAPTPEA